MRFPTTVVVCAVLCAVPAAALAEPWPTLKVTGTPAQWGELAGWHASRVERVRLLRDLVFLFYSSPAIAEFGALERLSAAVMHLDTVERRNNALILGTTDWRQWRGQERRALVELLDALGYEVTGESAKASIRPSGDAPGRARRALLEEAGFTIDPFLHDLQTGRPARASLPSFTIPLPLGADYWRTRLVQRPLTDTALALEIVQNRRWALLYVGVLGLDRDTLNVMSAHASFLSRLSIERLAPLAAFSRSIRIERGRVVTPGGPASSDIWQRLVGAPVDAPLDFVERLLSVDDGRLAWFFDFVQRAEPNVQDYALSLWEADVALRTRRVESLYHAFRDVAEVEGVDFRHRPFARPAFEPSIAVSVAATAAGDATSGSSITFWREVFGALELPAVVKGPYSATRSDDVFDAAALIRLVLDRDKIYHRLDDSAISALLVAQSFARRDPSMPSDTKASIARASIRFPALIRSLERMRASSTTASRVISRALVLSGLDSDRFHLAMGQFQAALAIVERLALIGSIAPDQADALVAGLAAIPLDDDRRFAGGVLRWLATTMLPLAAARAEMEAGDPARQKEQQLLGLLAGHVVGRSTPTFEWDGLRYRVDPATATFEHLKQARARDGATTVDAAVGLVDFAASLTSTATVASARAGATRLRSAAATFGDRSLDRSFEAESAVRRALLKAALTLAQVRSPKDAGRAAQASREVLRTLDWVSLDLLRALVYVPHTNTPRGGLGDAVDLARRHDLGSLIVDQSRRERLAWALPRVNVGRGVRWHVEGAFLAFDHAAVNIALVETVPGPPMRGEFDAVDRAVLLRSAIAPSADQAPDEALLSAIHSRLAEARRHLASGTAPPAARFDWGAGAYEWARTNEPEAADSVFSLVELLDMGSPFSPSLASLGSQFQALTGSLRLVVPPRVLQDGVPGYVGRGYYATGTLDLKLRIAELMYELHVPALVASLLTARATATVLTDTSPGAAFDWITMRRRMAHFSTDEVGAIISALASEGTMTAAFEAPAETSR